MRYLKLQWILIVCISTVQASIPNIIFPISYSKFGPSSGYAAMLVITNQFQDPMAEFYDKKGNLQKGTNALHYLTDTSGKIITNTDGSLVDCRNAIIVDLKNSGSFWTIDQIARSWNGSSFGSFVQMTPGSGMVYQPPDRSGAINFWQAFTYGPETAGIQSLLNSPVSTPAWVRLSPIAQAPVYKAQNFVGNRFFISTIELNKLATQVPLAADNLVQSAVIGFFQQIKDVGQLNMRDYLPALLAPKVTKNFYVGITTPYSFSLKTIDHNDFVIVWQQTSTWFTCEDIMHYLEQGTFISTFDLSGIQMYTSINNTATGS